MSPPPTAASFPSGRSKLIQPLETGVIGAIHVRDGQKVRAGDVLIELDPTMTDAEQERFQSELTSAQIEVARLRAALAWQDKPEGDPSPKCDCRRSRAPRRSKPRASS